MDVIDAALRSNISRVVALLTPLLSGAIAAFLLWLQNVAGIDLQVDPAAAAAFVGTVVLGGCLTGLKWLEGRAKFEQAALAVQKAHELGKTNWPSPEDAVEDPDDGTLDHIGDDPTVPPGADPGHEPLE